ncbi:FxDxF family PEP-CTERM protein [Pseudaquabacterium pictum]|uniref:Ice-binding protein C-terminal domain-containing protein n=1 Tax=Pseudaquabacterium pictum TaxID=2315236 RepID=A0A480ARN2_9BURK|nr:FxDxF family PEP-CTERM protein [Rubrivivax pictus]GCL62355.1 hypothetical protein AQPW35_14360 [Rubrivivax pictus]
MKLKQVTLGVALALSGLAANAADVNLGADPDSFSVMAVGGNVNFFDTFSFSLTTESVVNATAVSFGGIRSGSAWSIVDSMDNLMAGTYSLTTIPASLASLTLGAGDYAVVVTGKGQASGGMYGVSVNVTPVPEPETYAMMLAGLAALGFLARRRQG